MIRKAILRLLMMEAGISMDEWLKFQLWAFGGVGKGSIVSWNRLHSDLFTVQGSDIASQTLKRMVWEWRNNG